MKQVDFHVFWKPGKDNLADYFMNHHPALHHIVMKLVYIHPSNTSDSSRQRGSVNYSREKPRVNVNQKLKLLEQRYNGTPK